MVNLTIDPAVDVTQACVRRRFVFFLPRLRQCLSGAGFFAGAGAGQHRYDALHSLWRLSVCLSC